MSDIDDAVSNGLDWGLDYVSTEKNRERAETLVKVFKDLPDVKSCLDLLCGSGQITTILAREFPGIQFTAVDKKRYPHWMDYDNLKFIQKDLFRFIEEDFKADIIYIGNSFRNWSSLGRRMGREAIIKEYNNFCDWVERNSKYFLFTIEKGKTNMGKVVGTEQLRDPADSTVFDVVLSEGKIDRRPEFVSIPDVLPVDTRIRRR